MKTKTLLIAAAALAAGVISSQAQVYSANIVGYANVVCPASTLVLLANPLDNGTNTANDVFASLLCLISLLCKFGTVADLVFTQKHQLDLPLQIRLFLLVLGFSSTPWPTTPTHLLVVSFRLLANRQPIACLLARWRLLVVSCRSVELSMMWEPTPLT